MMMKNHISVPVLLLGVCALVLSPVDAKPGGGNGKDKGGGGGGQSEKGNKGEKGDKGGGGKEKGGKGGPDQQGKPDKGPDQQAKNDKKDKPDKIDKVEKMDKPEKDKGKDFRTEEIVRFKDPERGAIVEYFGRYKDNDRGLPPGLAKNLRRGKPLPPGWQDRYSSGYRIEDEYWDSFTPVPYDWFPSLRRDPDVHLYYYGDRIVRVYEPRREIVEVIVVPTLRF
jgi:hypothetical protein